MKRAAIFTSPMITALAFGIFFTASAARADIPPPPRDVPAGKTFSPIDVSYDPNKDVSFLYIGRETLKSAGGDAEKQSLRAPGTTRSIVAAAALSLGLAGIVLLRGKRRSQIACGLVLAIGLGAIGIEAWANAPAPIPPEVLNGPVELKDGAPNFRPKTIHGDVVIEIVDGDRAHQVQLVIGTKPKPAYVPRGPVNPPPVPKKKT